MNSRTATTIPPFPREDLKLTYMPISTISVVFNPPLPQSTGSVSAAEIEKMTTSERLQAMESLWDALCREPDKLNSPNWHGEVLSDRRTKIEDGEASFVSLKEARRRLLG